ncbi:MAG: glycosyltransferase family 2 protein [Bacteroidales bacterium]|nr:glycosyltransferase family 2 protein [Bacteroidales bacterium]
MISLSIVVPCYNEEQVLKETASRLVALMNQMADAQQIDPQRSSILFVNDGSSDQTWPLIVELHQSQPYVCGVKLAGNVGHQNALMAGLDTARTLADAIISIDADLQDDINVIPEMVSLYAEGYDIVYGVRRERTTDTWFKRNTALGFYHLMRWWGVRSVYNHADFRLMSRRAVEQLGQYRERNLFLRGIVPLIGYKTTQVYYDRAERFAGESKYPLSKMINFAIDGITSFSVAPVRMIIYIGLAFILISVVMLGYVMVSLANGTAVPGWSSLLLSLWFIGGSVLLSIGVVGEYIGKIYLEVKARPRYNIEEICLKK